MSNPYQPPSPYAAPSALPPMAMRHSGLGVAACMLAVLGVMGLVGLVALAGFMEESRPGGLSEDDPAAIAIGVGIMALALLELVALGLGIGGLFQPNRLRALAIAGIVVSASTLLGVAMLLAIGAAME